MEYLTIKSVSEQVKYYIPILWMGKLMFRKAKPLGNSENSQRVANANKV